MAKKRSTLKASDKAAQALAARMQDFAAANIPADTAALPSAQNIEVTRKSQKTELTARRADAFDALKQTLQPGCWDAVRDLERDILAAAGLGRPPSTGRVDCTAGFTTDDMLIASDRVRRVKTILPPRDWWLIADLLSSSKPWRDVVAYVTGEAHEMGQSAAVRAACVNLRDLATARKAIAA
jgi:hypothetical protein